MFEHLKNEVCNTLPTSTNTHTNLLYEHYIKLHTWQLYNEHSRSCYSPAAEMIACIHAARPISNRGRHPRVWSACTHVCGLSGIWKPVLRQTLLALPWVTARATLMLSSWQRGGQLITNKIILGNSPYDHALGLTPCKCMYVQTSAL